MEKNLSYANIEWQMLHLRLTGYYQIDPRSPELHKFLHRIYRRFVLVLMIVYTVQQALKVYEVRNDMDEVMETMFLFLTHTDSIYKQIVMWLKEGKVEYLLDTMRGSLYNQGKSEHEKILIKMSKKLKLLLYGYNGIAIVTCFLWFIYPVIIHMQGKYIQLPIWLPYDENKDLYFYVSAIYVGITTTWLAFSNTTMDVTVSAFLANSKAQLTILGYNLKHLVRDCKEESIKEVKSFNDVFEERFKHIILHHVEIVKYINSWIKLTDISINLYQRFITVTADIFGTVVGYQFLISGWIMCTSVYRMVNCDIASLQFLSMVTYMICVLFQTFIYCYFGSEVTYESMDLTNCAYAMEWTEIPKSHRKSLFIFMESVKRPMICMAGHIIPLSNDTFVSVVKSSYSFYALLQNTNE